MECQLVLVLGAGFLPDTVCGRVGGSCLIWGLGYSGRTGAGGLWDLQVLAPGMEGCIRCSVATLWMRLRDRVWGNRVMLLCSVE